MYRLNDIVSSFSSLVGWKDTELSASESGLYFQEAHPLLTLRALRGVMPKDLLSKYPEYLGFPADFRECIMMIPQAEIDNNPFIGPEDQNPYVE